MLKQVLITIRRAVIQPLLIFGCVPAFEAMHEKGDRGFREAADQRENCLVRHAPNVNVIHGKQAIIFLQPGAICATSFIHAAESRLAGSVSATK